MLRRWQQNFAFDGRLLDEAGDGKDGGGSGDSGNPEDKGAEGNDGGDAPPPEGDKKQKKIEDLDPESQAIIKKLRNENATLRTRSKTTEEQNKKILGVLKETGIIENDDEDPKDKLSKVSERLGVTEHRAAILEAALEHEVPKASVEYFEFLVQRRLSGLKDGEELSDEDLASLALEAKQKSGVAPKKSGVGGGGDPAPKDKGKGGEAAGGSEISAQKFAKLSMSEKSALYAKNPDEYKRLFSEAKEKRLI